MKDWFLGALSSEKIVIFGKIMESAKLSTPVKKIFTSIILLAWWNFWIWIVTPLLLSIRIIILKQKKTFLQFFHQKMKYSHGGCGVKKRSHFCKFLPGLSCPFWAKFVTKSERITYMLLSIFHFKCQKIFMWLHGANLWFQPQI